MKKLILLSVLFIAFISVKAQESTFLKGDKIVNLGIGIDYARIPIYIAGDYCVKDGIIDKGSIGIGAYAGVSYYYYHYYSKSIYINVGGRGSFHYPFINKLDTYAGLSIGIDTWNSYFLDFGSFVGARYYLSPKLAAFGELAYGGIGYLTAGIAFKF